MSLGRLVTLLTVRQTQLRNPGQDIKVLQAEIARKDGRPVSVPFWMCKNEDASAE